MEKEDFVKMKKFYCWECMEDVCGEEYNHEHEICKYCFQEFYYDCLVCRKPVYCCDSMTDRHLCKDCYKNEMT